MIRCLSLLLLGCCCGVSQQTAADRLQPLHFLLGEWVGAGEGQPGSGTGRFTFEKDLDGKVLIRRSRADYPRTKDRPAFAHTDLTVVFSSSAGIGAFYFDNEGHRIQYKVDADQNTVSFLSDSEPGAPRFRLIYRKEGDGLRVRFEMAPPGTPDAFQMYTEGVVTRVAHP